METHRPSQAIEAIDEAAWRDIDYTLAGQAQVAETVYVSGKGNKQRRATQGEQPLGRADQYPPYPFH